jgi:HEAT repeat protein
VTKEAALALGALGVRSHARAIHHRLNSDLADLRKAAVSALAELGAVFAVPRMRELLTDPDAEVSKAARRALHLLDR